MRRIPASLPWAAAYAHARATAWLTAVRKAADKLPQQRAISMGAVTPAERRALAAQLYTARRSAAQPGEANPLHAVVTLQPRSQAERQIRVALRNAELLELRQRLMEETRATLKCMNRHWPGRITGRARRAEQLQGRASGLDRRGVDPHGQKVGWPLAGPGRASP